MVGTINKDYQVLYGTFCPQSSNYLEYLFRVKAFNSPSCASRACAAAKRQGRNSKSNKNRGRELFSLSCGSIFSNFAVKMMNFSIYFVV